MGQRFSILIFAIIVLATLALVFAYRAPLDPIEPPPRQAFQTAAIERGANLAAIGNCAGCHNPIDGAPFSGGLPLKTPFGTVHASNITPEPATGIGRWSQTAFVRAMRDGIARDGTHLYPAFPYDHFRRSSDDDLAALYAFVMTRSPVVATSPANAMRFPFGLRPLVAAWNALFLDRRAHVTDPQQGVAWNRGAYLTESLAHCGACHTPRNALGAEQRERALAGGEAEGWYAPPLDANSPSPLPWSVASLTEYLRTGIAPDHAIAGGPMRSVVANLANASEVDVRAIAVYIVSRMQSASAASARERRADASAQRAQQPLPAAETVATAGDAQQAFGASVYASSCAGCHDLGRGLASDAALRLPLAVAVHDADPRSLLRIIRDGIAPSDGAAGRWMPAFGNALTDDQLTALLAYLRRYAAAAPPWPALATAVRESRGPLRSDNQETLP